MERNTSKQKLKTFSFEQLFTAQQHFFCRWSLWCKC